MISNTTVAIAGILLLAGVINVDTLRAVGRVEPEFVFEDIQVGPEGYSNIRHANVPALPVKWFSAVVRENSSTVLCAGFGDATVSKVKDNRYGPLPLDKFIGADCSAAHGEYVTIRTVVQWQVDRTDWRAVEHISDEFLVK